MEEEVKLETATEMVISLLRDRQHGCVGLNADYVALAAIRADRDHIRKALLEEAHERSAEAVRAWEEYSDGDAADCHDAAAGALAAVALRAFAKLLEETK
jgi:hypothetical protein